MSTGSSFSSETGTTRGTADTGGINTYKGEERALRADRLGTPGLLLSVVAASAPLMVVAGVMPTVFGVMGIVGQPLLYIILGVVLMLFGVGYAEMSRHVHNAGAFYAYIARGLGPTAGAGASLVALVAYSAMQVGIYGILGFEVSGIFATYLDIELAWWIPALVSAAVVGVLGWLKIDLNAKVLGVLLVIECALVVIFDIAAVSKPGPEGLSLHAFNPETLAGAGLGTALCFCVAAFVGFEQAPVYAEETSRPQIVVSRVMFLAVGYAALFLAISSWALTVAAGPGFIADTSLKEGLEEQRQPDDRGDQDHRPGHRPAARLRQDGVDDLIGPAGVGEQLAEDRAERDQDAHARDSRAEARGETGDRVGRGGSGEGAERQRTDGQRQERVHLELGDEENDDGDARQDGDAQLSVACRGDRFGGVRCQHLDAETGHGDGP
ncbi:hypothetical protein SBADM41S_00884 [Streptomyces badius]